ncbi:hypothetical protein AAF712_014575 [Marasmius tenuissimus]|uniref:Uncharacterized protein n=1 Tax=Marasmius tenuissimus TaxID=585030 RepID=A0ABR2ZE69_9AGAR
MTEKCKLTITDLPQSNIAKPPIAKRAQLGNTVTTIAQDPSGLPAFSVRGQAQPLAGPSMSGKPVIDDREMKKEEDADGDEAAESRSAGETLKDFEAIVSELTTWLLLHEYDSNLNLPCSCGTGERIVQCQDCQDFEICCKDCWILHTAPTLGIGQEYRMGASSSTPISVPSKRILLSSSAITVICALFSTSQSE